MAFLKQNQNLTDFTLQHCGALDNWFDVASINGLGITDNANVGNNLKIPSQINRPLIVAYYVNKKTIPATNFEYNTLPIGIGAMGIGSTFKIA